MRASPAPQESSTLLEPLDLIITYDLEDGTRLLDAAHLKIPPEAPCLIIGDGGIAYEVLGGLIAGAVPMKDASVPWQPIADLIRPYTGTLLLSEGTLPANSIYISPDPEQLLVFSRLEDNLLYAGFSIRESAAALSTFHLDETFLRRRVSSLSGGERVRAALAIAFAKRASCRVLHGVTPWLDTEGREALRSAIRHTRRSSHTILLEHEASGVLPEVRIAYSLERGRLVPIARNSVKARAEILPAAKASGRNSRVAVLKLDHVRFFNYEDAQITRAEPLLRDVSFTVCEGECFCIVGPNGSGKSTLAKLLFALFRPDDGTIEIDGRRVSSLSQDDISARIGFVGQYPMRQLTMPCMSSYRKHCRGSPIALNLLTRWITRTDDVPVVQLTELERRLLAIAVGIRSTTRVLILDEPTWGLSLEDQVVLASRLRELKARRAGLAVLMVSHNHEFADALGAEVHYLYGGEICQDPRSKAAAYDRRCRSRRMSRWRLLLSKIPIWARLAGLLIAFVLCFGFVFFVPSDKLGLYVSMLLLLSGLLLVVLRQGVRRDDLHLLLGGWAIGTILYLPIAGIIVLSGASLTPYMALNTELARWLYALSHSIRLLLIMGAGLLFMEYTSPLELGVGAKRGARIGMLFRSVEYAKDSLSETMHAMAIGNRWPRGGLQNLAVRQVMVAVGRVPELVSTVIRNTLLWAPWAWMMMSQEEKDKYRSGGGGGV